MKFLIAALGAAALLAVLPPASARADEHREQTRAAPYDTVRRPHYSPGQRVRRLPERHVRVVVGGNPFYYYGGTFYRHARPDYVVVRAPLGAHVRTLPPGYVAFGIGGRNFFYVNATYYLWEPRTRDYVVIEEPEGASAALAAPKEETAGAGELFAYPNQSQSEEQQRRDRYECHLWAADESGYDPTYEDQPAALADDYRRAMTACLVGRGYTVR